MYIHYLGRGALPLPGASPRSTGWNREARLSLSRRALSVSALLVCLSTLLHLFCGFFRCVTIIARTRKVPEFYNVDVFDVIILIELWRALLRQARVRRT